MRVLSRRETVKFAKILLAAGSQGENKAKRINYKAEAISNCPNSKLCDFIAKLLQRASKGKLAAKHACFKQKGNCENCKNPARRWLAGREQGKAFKLQG
jgi:hypothetical protein